MVSTANDLLKLVGVAMGYEDSKLAPTMAKLLEMRRPAGDLQQALGWMVMGEGADQIVLHDGGSLGFASSVAWMPQQRVGVVVLMNQAGNVGDISRHLLKPSLPLAQVAPARHTEITLDAATLDSFAGRYDLEDEGVTTIAREGGLLTIELPTSWGLPKVNLHAEGQRDFFATELPLRVTFEVDANKRVTGMQVHPPRSQRTIPARRLQP
jgi:hypothetical protein